MPYKNREKQLAAQRAWNRKQTEQRRAERMRLEGRESTRPAASTASRSPIESTAPSPRRLTATGLRQPTPSTERYSREREAGKNESGALSALRHDRAGRQRERQDAEHERAEQAHIRARLPQARQWLSASAGAWTDADAWNVARRMVEQDRTLWPAPRQGDAVKTLPAPRLPALPPPQRAAPIWQGVRRPATVARVTLGNDRRVLPEEARQAIVEAVASLARRGKL